MRLALVLVLLCAPAIAHAQSIELREGELALSLSDPLRIDASYALTALDVPLWIHAQVSPEAQGAGVSIGLRPRIATIDDYRLYWASRVGPVLYGLDGASGGVEAVSELLNVFGAGEVRAALTPRIDFAAAGGDQSAWRLRTTLALAVGVVEPIVAAWIAGEAGYTFDGESRGAFRLAASIVVCFRPNAIE